MNATQNGICCDWHTTLLLRHCYEPMCAVQCAPQMLTPRPPSCTAPSTCTTPQRLCEPLMVTQHCPLLLRP